MKWLQCSMPPASRAKLALRAAAFWCEIAKVRFCAMHLQSYVDSYILYIYTIALYLLNRLSSIC